MGPRYYKIEAKYFRTDSSTYSYDKACTLGTYGSTEPRCPYPIVPVLFVGPLELLVLGSPLTYPNPLVPVEHIHLIGLEGNPLLVPRDSHSTSPYRISWQGKYKYAEVA